MREIEIKARLTDRNLITQKLTSLGCVFEDQIAQNDTVYVKNVGSIEIYNANDVVLRIRIKNKDKIIFTLKKRMGNNLEAIEHETEVDSKEEMEQALFLMGYQEAMKINKTRIITHYNGCEICLDEVEGLGSFIEMEKLVEDGDGQQIQEELFQFFLSLGITRDERIMSGYDLLILENIYN